MHNRTVELLVIKKDLLLYQHFPQLANNLSTHCTFLMKQWLFNSLCQFQATKFLLTCKVFHQLNSDNLRNSAMKVCNWKINSVDENTILQLNLFLQSTTISPFGSKRIHEFILISLLIYGFCKWARTAKRINDLEWLCITLMDHDYQLPIKNKEFPGRFRK